MKIISIALTCACVCVLVCLGGCVTSLEDPAVSYPDNFTVHYLAVGQGDSELIQYKGLNMLVDMGPEDSAATLYSDLERYNATHIDILLITHPHADHTGDLATMERYGITFDTIYTDGLASNKIDDAKPLHMGDTFSLGDQRFKVLWPDVNTYTDKNDDSVVVGTEYGSIGFLFTGDATALAETSMISYRSIDPLDDYEVLKVGHHGSKYSTSKALLSVIEPQISVIEVGENDYGHPAEVTVDRLEEYGSTVYTTMDGDITVTTDGANVTVI